MSNTVPLHWSRKAVISYSPTTVKTNRFFLLKKYWFRVWNSMKPLFHQGPGEGGPFLSTGCPNPGRIDFYLFIYYLINTQQHGTSCCSLSWTLSYCGTACPFFWRINSCALFFLFFYAVIARVLRLSARGLTSWTRAGWPPEREFFHQGGSPLSP